VHFLENHDEERAAVRFADRTRPAAFLSYAIPGAILAYQGQMEGFTEKLPVQLIRPRRHERPDYRLLTFYERLIARVRDPLFRVGEMVPLGEQAGAVVWARRYGARVGVGVADVSRAPSAESPAIEIAAASLGVAEGARLRAQDLWTGEAVKIELTVDGRLLLAPGAVPSYRDNGAFVIELAGA
jgi:glycosidase